MTNKTLIFFSILFHLISFDVYSNEQLSFDVTEIEILDGGDKIIFIQGQKDNFEKTVRQTLDHRH